MKRIIAFFVLFAVCMKFSSFQSFLTSEYGEYLRQTNNSFAKYINQDDAVSNVTDSTSANSTMEYNAFDPSKISHVYHVGTKTPYGRSNNQLLTILHAVDLVLDRHGDLPNNHAVVAVSNWAFRLLKDIFHNGSNSTEFGVQLEQLRPTLLVHKDRLEALGLTEKHGKKHFHFKTKDLYTYVKRNRKGFTPEKIRKNRKALVGALWQHGIAKRNLALYNVVRDDMETKNNIRGEENERIKYVTIHSRWLEGECERRVGGLLPKDECWMNPSYIKAIMGGTIDRPIVLIGDFQNEKAIANLKNDSDIGPALIIPQEMVQTSKSRQPWSDMMIAIMSDTFIGTRVSTMATVVGLFRVIRGADPASNFIYTSQDNETSDIEVCEDCLFLCDGEQSNLCGHDIVYT